MSDCNCNNIESTDYRGFLEQTIAQTGKESDKVIPILHAIQHQYNYLPYDAIKLICEMTEISSAQLSSVATFYDHFRHLPAGEHIVKVCTGTACHVKGAERVYDGFRQHFDLEEGETTDKEKKFSIEKVACLGCCTLAPVVQIDDITYGHVETGQIPEIIDNFIEKIGSPKQKTANQSNVINSVGEIRLGLGSCCIASGSAAVRDALYAEMESLDIHVAIKSVGCVGICNQVPLLEIITPTETKLYTQVKASDIRNIIKQHFSANSKNKKLKNAFVSFVETLQGSTVADFDERHYSDKTEKMVEPFLARQKHIATEFCGEISPLDLDEYLSKDGFSALQHALLKTTPEAIIDEIKRSGLRGRGGAGFPTGLKWEIVSKTTDNQKYIICNGDEGDPGAFMDRMLLESYPFRVIEGMLIAAYAVGATKGFFYIRAEYPLAVSRIKQALVLCKDRNLLGNKILGSDFSIEISIVEGAGAFVCGEETALIASIEGKRGYPTIRPPFPAEKGLHNKPTLINNTETFSLVGWIIRNGADKFNAIGTEKSKGTKVFALAGKVARGGLIEVPMGMTVNDIVMQIGGGVANGKTFKAVQIGGPSGGCIPAEFANTAIDYDELIKAGAMMGSGGLVVLDNTDCMVDIARYFLSFTQEQSCGKCTFCRVGTKRMLEILDRICCGQGKQGDIEKLESLAYQIKQGSLCGLGKTAPNPVLSTIKYFRSEYEAHINGSCPACKCQDLIYYHINDSCIGCTKCAQRCPVNAIAFEPHQIHTIDTDLCTKCDVCRQVCPVDSIQILTGKKELETT